MKTPFSILKKQYLQKSFSFFWFAVPSAICFSDKQYQWVLYWDTYCYLDLESLFLFGNAKVYDFFFASEHVFFSFRQKRDQDRNPSIWASLVKISLWRMASQEPFVTVSMHKKWENSYFFPLHVHIQITHSQTHTDF